MAQTRPMHWRPVPHRCLISALATRQHGKRRGTQSQKSASGRRTLVSPPGLRQVPGIGPKNEQLLIAKGIDSISRLNSVFLCELDRDVDKLAEYLRQEVGIRHKNHCTSIASYVAKNGKERVTFSVEGNISAGKSTFLHNLLEEPMELRDLVEVVEEPVELWQRVDGDPNCNLLERFYSNPERFAYEFQNYVFLTRLRQNRTSWEGEKPLRLLERSVFSDRLVFVRAVHEAKWMDDMQLKLYDSWFQPMLQDVPGLVPDGFIYLRADPSTCMGRLKKRARSEEVGVDLSYLEGLHVKHEDWFYQDRASIETKSLLYPSGQRSEAKIQCGTEPLGTDLALPKVPKELEGSVIFLGGKGVLSAEPQCGQHQLPNDVKDAISSIPALVLDCNEDFDVKNDVEEKRRYASKVCAYFNYVKAYRRARRSLNLTRPFYLNAENEFSRLKWEAVKHMPYAVLKELEVRGGSNILGSHGNELNVPHHYMGFQGVESAQDYSERERRSAENKLCSSGG